MKKLFIFLFAVLLLVGTVSAQNRGERQRERESVTVSGTLKLENGIVALESGDTVYTVPILTRYIGFINGLKEGAAVSVEGFSFRNMIHPVKVVIDGKSYEFNVGAPERQLGRAGSDSRYGNNRPQRTGFESRRGNVRPEQRFHGQHRFGYNRKSASNFCRNCGRR